MAKANSRRREYIAAGKKVVQTDYVEHGSDDHAHLLGLRPATKDDEFQDAGWAFEDATQFGAAAQPFFIKAQLHMRVSELTAPKPPVQDRDPLETGYAPPMFNPSDGQVRIVSLR